MHDYSKSVRDFVNNHSSTEPLLPLTHVTNMSGFRSIITGYSLSPQECKVFGQNLLYFFYGRPSYRATHSASSKLSWNIPIAFIVKPEAISGIKSIFPFDSGAYTKGLYGETFDGRSSLSDFDLGRNIEVASRYVSAFHGDNRDYFEGRSKKIHDFGNFDFELQGLQNLAELPGIQSHEGKNSVDERASAIEIVSVEELTIENSLIGIIVPEHLIPDEIFKEAISRWNLKDEQILPYPSIVGPGSEAWVGLFYSKVYDLYKSHGYFSENA